jgi:non-heme chloroperoxidase
MSFVTAADGTQIYYKDWGKGRPIVFSHGWPLSGDDWDQLMMFFGERGFRVIAHDRRGHGRSGQTWAGNEMDTYAADLAVLTSALDLKDAIHVGHSTGGGEATRYVARHGKGRVSKIVLVGAVPPLMVKTAANPGGLPIKVFDDLRAQLLADRAELFRGFTEAFYGLNKPGPKVSQGIRDNWWRQGMMCGVKPAYDCIKAFSETDFTDDLKKIDVPALVVHGSEDQIVPIGASAHQSSKLLKNATLKVYEGGPHGIFGSWGDRLCEDMLAFIKT